MSQHPYISQELLQDPCLRFRSYSILIIRFCGPAQAKRKFWPRRRVLCGPAQGNRDPRERFAQAKRKFWAPETRFVWPCAGKTVRPSVSRRRNANFELPRCIFCGPAQAKRKFWPPETHLRSRWSGFTRSQNRRTKIATALQRDAKKNSQQPFRMTSGDAFFVALRSKKRAGQKKAPRPKRLYPYRKNPSVWHTVWGKSRVKSPK